jgi:hypothetical protein
MTILRILGGVADSLWSVCVGLSCSSMLVPLIGAVGGAVLAAWVSRCLVTLFKPTRICEAIVGDGTLEGSTGVALVARFRFLPLEGRICVLRCSPIGPTRLQKSDMLHYSQKAADAWLINSAQLEHPGECGQVIPTCKSTL